MSEYRTALNLIKPKASFWMPKVRTCSSREGTGFDEIWNVMSEFLAASENEGHLDRRRSNQRVSWMWKMVEEELFSRLTRAPQVRDIVHDMERQVLQDRLLPHHGAEQILDAYERHS
eukprot:TRINITY_DN10705_c0_g1_i1.p1 TRINITY_DN10705_c0_g1~~TRINITY_DN10705_c0_g1_i1.p1  ORF type:complete len:137 (+),score=21.08 TRINITY_DN10705_c0_g1_i1:62-412(+)